MLKCDRINISEEIDLNKTNASNKCDICHIWYFKDINFKYEPYLCNDCHDLTQKAISFNNATIFYVKRKCLQYLLLIYEQGRCISIMNNSNLVDKKGVL